MKKIATASVYRHIFLSTKSIGLTAILANAGSSYRTHDQNEQLDDLYLKAMLLATQLLLPKRSQMRF